MRERKSRVWDNVNKVMLTSRESWGKIWWDENSQHEYDYHSLSLSIDNAGHVLEHTDEHGVCDMHFLLQGKPKYELMDWVGLKGKDGKEIYEGDKVLFQMGTGEVIFEFGALVLAIDERNRFYFGLWVEGEVFDGVVVGNIYEDALSD